MMKPGIAISEEIERELLSWPDVTVGQHRFGGREFRIGKREIGHLHGSAVAELPFPRAMRDELISSGKVSPHPHVPDSGWVSFHLQGEDDIPFALALFRRNYERIHALVQRQPANADKNRLARTHVAQVSKSAGRGKSCVAQVWRPATQQTCPSPLRFDASAPKPEAKAGKSALQNQNQT
jgi:hypothetical protein